MRDFLGISLPALVGFALAVVWATAVVGSEPPTAAILSNEIVPATPEARRNGEAPQPEEPRDYGFDRGMERRFEVQRELARGGNGVVHLVLDRTTGLTYAMKTIPKTLTDPNLSEK